MKALMFKGVNELADFVGALEGALSQHPVSLYALSALKEHELCALVLTGYQKAGVLKALIHPELEGELTLLKDQCVTLKTPDGASQKLQVLHCFEGLGFEAIAPLRPWARAPEDLSDRSVLFITQRSEDITQLALDCFKLNNDQLELATLESDKKEGDGEGEESKSYLLKALNPSYFLIQRFLSERAELSVMPVAEEASVQVFYELKPRLFVPWGFELRAPHRWVNAEPPQAGLTLLKPTLVAPPTSFQELSWEGVYERAQFKLNAQEALGWRPAEAHELSFEVPLIVNSVARPRSAELWLLEADDLNALERLLSVIDEEELDELLISVQEREGGGGRYFLKKRPGAQGKSYLDLGGRAFSTYLGHQSLFVSCDVELQPRLRRDRYPELFELKRGELTVLDARGAPSEEARLYRFDEQSFEPLRALSAYHIQAAQEQLISTAHQALFDLSPYDGSPALTDVLQRLAPLLSQGKGTDKGTGKGGALNPEPGARAGEVSAHSSHRLKSDKTGLKRSAQEGADEELEGFEELEELEEETTGKGKRVRGLARPQRNKRKAQGNKRSTSEEATLKSEVLNSLIKTPTLAEQREAWATITTLKVSAGVEAQEAMFELAWLQRDHLTEADEDEELTALLGETLSDALYARLSADLLAAQPEGQTPLERTLALLQRDEGLSLGKQLAAIFCTLKISQLSVGERHEPLVALVSAVERLEGSWGKRARWLLWRHISALSASERQRVRAREQVLGELNEGGFTVYDVPSVIVKHLNAKRVVQTSDKSEEAQAEVALALTHLSTLDEALVSSDHASPRALVCRVLLTRTYHELNMRQERDELFGGLIEALSEQAPLPCAWGVNVLMGARGLLNQTMRGQCAQLLAKSMKQMSATHKEELRTLQLMKLQRDQRERARARSDLTKQSSNVAFDAHLKDLPELSAELQSLQELTRVVDYLEVERRFTALLATLSGLFSEKTLLQPLCFVSDQLDALCVKIKWFPNASAFLSPLQTLNETIKAALQGRLDTHQAALLRHADASIASAHIKLIGERSAKEKIAELWGELERSTQPWEALIPTFELALRVIHSLELRERAEMIERFTSVLRQHHPEEHTFSASNLGIIDQLVEACVSKEELATNAYQEYCEREELTLRDSILSGAL